MSAAPPSASAHPALLRRQYFETLLGVRFGGGNAVRLLRNGDQIFPAMLDAIAAAEHRIEFLTFVYWTGDIAGKFADALSAKAREGVTVRVLLDAFGAKKMPRKCVEQMQAAGVIVRWFRPMRLFKPWSWDNRTHRKVLVCDQHIGFTGGVGIAKEWEGDARHPGEWRETHLELQGPAVQQLASAFWDNWLEAEPGDAPPLDERLSAPPAAGEDELTVVRSTAGDYGSEAAICLRAAIRLAQRDLVIITPYLVIGEHLRRLLCAKAREGVRVRLLIPGPHLDHQFVRYAAERDFEELLDAGVEIFRYLPTMIHQKTILVDNDLSIIGSANVNQRSMRRDAELLLILSGEKHNRALRDDLQADLARAEQAHDARFAHRPWWRRLLERLMDPFRSQL